MPAWIHESLHDAALWNNNPELIVLLVEFGAVARAKTVDGKAPRDLSRFNEALHGTGSWWLLNEFGFG